MQAEHKGNTRGARKQTAYAFIIIYSKRRVAQKVRACTGLPKTDARRRFESCPVSIAFFLLYFANLHITICLMILCQSFPSVRIGRILF